MNKIQLITATAILSASFGLGGFLAGKAGLQNQIARLEDIVETVQIEKQIIGRENYQLHLDLIKKGNPYGWELWGDALGNWGYRKTDENAILGTAGDGYIYLEQNR
jgi:hypothetical protein